MSRYNIVYMFVEFREREREMFAEMLHGMVVFRFLSCPFL